MSRRDERLPYDADDTGWQWNSDVFAEVTIDPSNKLSVGSVSIPTAKQNIGTLTVQNRG